MKIYALLAFGLILTGCTMFPDAGKPDTVYPDASTPAGHDEYNGGIMDNTLVVDGRKYDTVTPDLAGKVERWQGNRNGFITDPRTMWQGATAIDKGVMFRYDFH